MPIRKETRERKWKNPAFSPGNGLESCKKAWEMSKIG